MDHSIYVAMTGASQIMRAQDAVSHNLANASTTGFKSELTSFTSVPVLGDGQQTRINAVAYGLGNDMSEGSIQQTGGTLDIAVRGPGFIAVQAPDGSEAYTRAGDLKLTGDGTLTDSKGNPVIGGGGPITLANATKLQIGEDGTISAVPQGQGPETVTTLDRIKLVAGDAGMAQGNDGLLHMADGSTAQADDTVRLETGALEGSNVNASAELVKMISLSRQYEMAVKSIKTAEDNADSSIKLLSAN